MKTFSLLLLAAFVTLRLVGQAPENGSYVHFNFEQVEIRNLVTLVGEQTGKRFVLDGDIEGRVSIITREKIPQDEVFPLFVAALEGSGYTVVEREGVYYIRALVGEDTLQAPVVGADMPLTGVGMLTRVIKLQHVRAVDVKPLLEPMVRLSDKGSLSAFAPTNHLIVTDTASNIARVESLLAELDKPGQSTNLSVIPLKHAPARELAEQISAALRGAESGNSQVSRRVQSVVQGGGTVPLGFSLVAAEQANALIVSAEPLQLQQIRDMVMQLDVPAGSSSSGRLNAVFLNYVSAERAAEQLTALLDKRKPEAGQDPIAVTADIPNNAIIVDAGPLAFAEVRSLLEKLDLPPQQVLVEVMIVEVAETDSLDLGVELATVEQPNNDSTVIVGRSSPGEVSAVQDFVTNQAFPQGFTFALSRGSITLPDGTVVPSIPFLVEALQGKRDVNILSHVPLRTQNNAEATVSVVDNIPILTSVIEGGTGSDRDVIQNIERIDVGIKLTVRPQVNPNREITLKLNPAIEAIIQQQASADTPLTPTIARREVESTLTMPERATVVISGLMREDVIEEVRKVPLLGSLPVVGFFFRNTSERKQKTNLLIFVTPYLVNDAAENAEAEARWRERTGIREASDEEAEAPEAP